MNASSWWSVAALGITSTIAFVALLKEKREKPGKRWHRNALFALTGLGLVVGLVVIHQAGKDTASSEQHHKDERALDEEQIAGLTQSIQTQIDNNETQYLRNQEEVHRLQDQLTDLKKQVATEEVRKKMDALRSQLDKVLTPAPRAKLQSRFWVSAVQDDVVTEIYAPVDNNIVTFSFDGVNHSDVDAKNGAVWLRICNDCKFNKQPQGFEHVPGAPDFERLFKFGDLPSGSRMQRIEVEVQVPPNSSGKMVVFTKYRCDNCEIQKDWQQMWVTLGNMLFRKP